MKRMECLAETFLQVDVSPLVKGLYWEVSR